MFKLYTFGLALLFAHAASSQVIYLEDFEDNSLEGFTLYNLDGLVPDDPDLATMEDSAWTVRTITAQGWEFNRSAFSVSWYVNDEGPSDDWLVTPGIELGQSTVLEWDALAITSSGEFRDQYQVFISTGPELADLENADLVFDTGTEGELPEPTHHTLDLEELGYSNTTVYIAFRNFTQPFTGDGTGGNELAIDNIMVSSVSSASQTLLDRSLSVYPNPSQQNENLTVEFDAQYAQPVTVQLIDLTGKTVVTRSLRASAGSNRFELIAGNLAEGMYTLRLLSGTESAGKTVVIR